MHVICGISCHDLAGIVVATTIAVNITTITGTVPLIHINKDQ